MLRTRTCAFGFIAAWVASTIAPQVTPADDGYAAPIEVRTDADLPQVRTGVRFQQALEASVPGVAWKQVSLRDILRQLSDLYEVAIICDRRIDPTLTPELAASDRTLWEVVKEVCERVSVSPTVVGNCVYLGPLDSAGVVRTLVELRKTELLKLRNHAPSEQWIRLQRSRSVQWGDLESPRQILEQIVSRFSLEVTNIDKLPRDLCAAGQFREMTAAEMLTLVLIQYDFTFQWSVDLTAISLEPLPRDNGGIAIEKHVRFNGLTRTKVEELQQSWPQVSFRFEDNEVILRGRIEDVETVEAELRGRGKFKSPNVTPGAPVPLNQREFTLSVNGVPIQAIIDNLKQSGTTFEYDKELLENVGVDLQTPVSVNVKQASAHEFFAAVFRPIKVDFDIEGTTIRLRSQK